MQVLKRAGWVLACTLGVALAVGAQSQQPPPPKADEKKPPKKARKVWTQDDVARLRTPSDNYADKKAAEEAAAKAAAAASAAEQRPAEEASEQKPIIDPISGKPFVDPDSPEGLAEQLKRWEASLVATEAQLAEARSRLTQTTDPDRWESAKLEVDLLSQNVVDTQRRIEELKVRIAANPPKKDAGASAAAQPNPPPQPPPAPPPQS